MTVIINRDGRILIPKQVRKALGIGNGSQLEIRSYTETEIVIGKIEPQICGICGSTENLFKKINSNICHCANCVNDHDRKGIEP